MLESLVALLGITIGIIGLNIFTLFYPKLSFGLVGNSIIAVFGSVFFMKSFGRLGFNPQAIVSLGTINLTLLFINLVVSILGAIVLLLVAQRLKAYQS